MKIALVGDLHGNYVATQALEKALKKIVPEEIWFLGDAVGKGPQSALTCDWVRQHCTRFVGGNWDYGIGNREFSEDGYFWAQLGEERMQWLRELPSEMEATISGVRFRMFHGRPVTPLLKVQDDKQLLSQCFHANGRDYGGVIFADSHRPFLRTLDAGYIVNTGSVGCSMGVTRAHAVIVEGELDCEAPAPISMSILAVPYDNEAAASIARHDPDLPHQAEFITEVLTGVYARGKKD